MLKTRQQQELQQRSASSTGVQQQMRAELFLRTQRQPEPLDHIARMQAGVAVQQPALG